MRKRHFLSHLCIQMIFLPRQARDKRGKALKKRPFLSQPPRQGEVPGIKLSANRRASTLPRGRLEDQGKLLVATCPYLILAGLFLAFLKFNGANTFFYIYI